jgi:serine protease Do
VPGGPAAEGGVRPADIIVAIDGRPVPTSEEVGSAIDRHKPGETARVDVVRGGERRTLEVKLEQRPDAGDTVGGG